MKECNLRQEPTCQKHPLHKYGIVKRINIVSLTLVGTHVVGDHVRNSGNTEICPRRVLYAEHLTTSHSSVSHVFAPSCSQCEKPRRLTQYSGHFETLNDEDPSSTWPKTGMSFHDRSAQQSLRVKIMVWIVPCFVAASGHFFVLNRSIILFWKLVNVFVHSPTNHCRIEMHASS